ncbi:hypothetical protein N9595_00450, partial [Bacteroidia bacterium]|nr:hypothetical protein [Bacteroidia bacterium]
MKTGYKLFSLVLFACTIAQGQATAQDSFVFLGTAFDDQWSPRSIKVESEATAGSNSINTQMFSDVLFGTSFTESAKVKYLEGNQLKTNFYGHSINRVEYKIDSSHAVFVKYKSQIGFKANKDMAELMFWGNAPFEGENVVTENLKFTQANSISAGVSFKHASGEKWKIKGSYGINFITSLREVSANKAELYTAQRGSYANVNVESLSISERKDGIKGVGVDIDFEFDYSIDSVNSISMKALDFNFN